MGITFPTGTVPGTGGGGGGGGVTVHGALTGRSAADSHPISAITDLEDVLAALQAPPPYVFYQAAGTPSSPGGDITTEPLAGVGPWVTVPFDPAPLAGDPAVATINTTTFPGMVHYPVLALYKIDLVVVTDAGEAPGVAYDGRIAPGNNSGQGGTFVASKVVYAGPDTVDNELIFGSTDASTLTGAYLQIVRF